MSLEEAENALTAGGDLTARCYSMEEAWQACDRAVDHGVDWRLVLAMRNRIVKQVVARVFPEILEHAGDVRNDELRAKWYAVGVRAVDGVREWLRTAEVQTEARAGRLTFSLEGKALDVNAFDSLLVQMVDECRIVKDAPLA